MGVDVAFEAAGAAVTPNQASAMARRGGKVIILVQMGMVDVKPLITHTFPLKRTAEALEMVAACEDGVLRAIIQISGE